MGISVQNRSITCILLLWISESIRYQWPSYWPCFCIFQRKFWTMYSQICKCPLMFPNDYHQWLRIKGLVNVDLNTIAVFIHIRRMYLKCLASFSMIKIWTFHSRTCVRKCRRQNGGRFVQRSTIVYRESTVHFVYACVNIEGLRAITVNHPCQHKSLATGKFEWHFMYVIFQTISGIDS